MLVLTRGAQSLLRAAISLFGHGPARCGIVNADAAIVAVRGAGFAALAVIVTAPSIPLRRIIAAGLAAIVGQGCGGAPLTDMCAAPGFLKQRPVTYARARIAIKGQRGGGQRTCGGRGCWWVRGEAWVHAAAHDLFAAPRLFLRAPILLPLLEACEAVILGKDCFGRGCPCSKCCGAESATLLAAPPLVLLPQRRVVP